MSASGVEGWRSWARAPIVRFAVIGAAIFAADRALAARSGGQEAGDPHVVTIDEAFVDALGARHRARTGRDPDAHEVEALVADAVREEALVREARAARLDVDDAIVRRRLVQKIEFVVAGMVEVGAPDDAALEAWIARHGSELERPARTRLAHVFFARDRRGARALDDARTALVALREAPDRARPEALGDPFLRGSAIGPSTDAQLAAALGAETAAAIAGAPVGSWSGPIESAYGWHVIRVEAREPARAPAPEEARGRAREGWMEEQRQVAVERELARIVAEYEVVRAP